jgi:hypothetical protein
MSQLQHVSLVGEHGVQVQSESGERQVITDAKLHDKILKSSPNGFFYGTPIPHKFYRWWPRLSTEYSSLPGPVAD